MAGTRPLDDYDLDLSAHEASTLPAYRRLGLLNGLLVGLALALGAWGADALRISRLPISLYVPSLLLGALLIIVISGFVGWLSSRIARTVVTVALWLATAVAFMLILGYLPSYGRSFIAWLADARFWGRAVYPSPYDAEGTMGGIILTGLLLGSLLILLVLGVLALLQGYRLENAVNEVGRRGLPSGRGWAALLWPLPLVFLASLVTSSMISNPAAAAAEVTYKAIERASAYEGDLINLDDEGGIDYGALRGVHDLLRGDYTLSIVDVNPLNSTVIIGANFDSGAWLYCRVINDQLSYCYDTTPAYTVGLRSLATGEPLPEDCRGCALRTTDEAAAWLAAHRDQFGPDPVIEREAQQGNHVQMTLTGESGFQAACWIEGITPIRLTSCHEIDR